MSNEIPEYNWNIVERAIIAITVHLSKHAK
jgi:hypothetical protein